MCLCGQPHFYLPADLVLSGTLEVLQAHLPGEVLFEGEGTPGLARTNVLGPHPQQDQIGYQGYCYRAFDPGSVLGHLVLSHTYHFLPFLEEQFHRPASQVPVRQFDLEPLASVIQSDPHSSTALQRSLISIECRNLTSPGCRTL